MLAYDPAIEAALAAAAEDAPPAPESWDIPLLRAQSAHFYREYLARGVPPSPDVGRTEVSFAAADGAEIGGRWYSPRAGGPRGAAVVYLHGGGMVSGSVDLHDPAVGWYAQASGVPFLAVEYRLAPESPGEGPVRDALAAIAWLVDHCDEYGVDPTRIAIMGDSAGGGIAAGAAILARDHGIRPARQILIYPMLDDRTTQPDPALVPHATWTYEMNEYCWRALLGDAVGERASSVVAVPARHPDLSGLADAYIEVGDLDIFRDEALAYAGRLARGGASVEVHVHPGAPHGYDWFAPDSALADRWRTDRIRAIRAI